MRHLHHLLTLALGLLAFGCDLSTTTVTTAAPDRDRLEAADLPPPEPPPIAVEKTIRDYCVIQITEPLTARVTFHDLLASSGGRYQSTGTIRTTHLVPRYYAIARDDSLLVISPETYLRAPATLKSAAWVTQEE